MLPKHIVYFLNFFDILTFNSGSSVLSNHNGIVLFIRFFHILVAVIFTIAEFKFLFTDIYVMNGIFSTANESLQYFTALYTYWLIILESIYHASSHKQFWNGLRQIDEKFYNQSRLSFRIYLMQIIEFFAVTISHMIFGMIDLLQNNIIFSYLVLARVYQIRVFYYVFCLEVVHFQLKSIEEELNEWETSNDIQLNRLKWLREYISCVHEMTCHLNLVFGWSNVAAILCCFYYILAAMNWIFLLNAEYLLCVLN